MSKPMTQVREELLNLPMSEASLEDLRSLFLQAAKPESEWMVGAEFEVFAVQKRDLHPADHGELAMLIEQIGASGSWDFERERGGTLVGLKGPSRSVSLEPGGQLEYATSPHRQLRAMRDELLAYCDELKEAGARAGLTFLCLGHQPFVHVEDAPRMPKARYDRMRSYLGPRGARAMEMMLLTGSIQCALDFSDETNLTNKIRTATRASPFIAALTSASPFTRGKPNGFKSVRYQVWLETDSERCGVWPEMLDAEGLTAERYIERALGVSPMFLMRDGQFRATEERPFAHFVEHGFEGQPVRVRDFLDHLTTFFPEVRVKNYVELRGSDCLQPRYVSALAGFWRGILDHEPTRLEVEDRLASMDFEAIQNLQPAVARRGLEADSAAGPVVEVTEWLIETAYQRLRNGSPDCAECLQPLRDLARNGRSPADALLERAAESSVATALREQVQL
ncbi:MAG TPA: glutamate-cysteine ligase family protein [Myxococcales bacterium LLY-WYZ-16_1]|jgi:glutamate--cysteine ligase|nr:glutamate-cysteine ligase family protein [Myxococcales bacterium LLY-WYZ-16_1]